MTPGHGTEQKGRMASLIERLEKAMGPDRELDGQIKLAVAAMMFMGGASKGETVRLLGGDLYAGPLPYTGDIGAALTIKPGATPIIALCIAALQARALLSSTRKGD